MPRPPKPQRLKPTPEALPVSMEAPPPPTGLLPATRTAWTEFWSSPLARLVQPADVPALARLHSLYDERQRAADLIRAERMVPGSKGQMRANPLYSHLSAMDTEIRQLEGQFGITPLGRMRLGVALGDAGRSLKSLNTEVFSDAPASPDPRLTYAQPAATDARRRGGEVDGGKPRARTG